MAGAGENKPHTTWESVLEMNTPLILFGSKQPIAPPKPDAISSAEHELNTCVIVAELAVQRYLDQLARTSGVNASDSLTQSAADRLLATLGRQTPTKQATSSIREEDILVLTAAEEILSFAIASQRPETNDRSHTSTSLDTAWAVEQAEGIASTQLRERLPAELAELLLTTPRGGQQTIQPHTGAWRLTEHLREGEILGKAT